MFAVGMTSFFSGPSLNSVVASPEDDRRLSYGQSSCGSIDLSTYQFQYPVLLYLLTRPPATTDGDVIQLTDTWILSQGDYKYYHYYLLQGSTVSFSLYVSQNPVTVMILTKSQFDKFDDDRSHSSELSNTCSHTTKSTACVYNYSVKTDGEYYLVSYAHRYSNTVYTSLTINKKIFVIDPSDVFSNCTADCLLSVPSSPSLYPVVRTGGLSGAGSWTDEINYTWRCTSAFAIPPWVYLLIISGVLAVVVSVIVTIATVLILYCKKKNANTTTASVERAPLVNNQGPPATAPPPSYAPPPTNPNIGPPPSYGWVDKN